MQCQKCSQLMEKPMLFLQFKDGKTWETGQKCSKCKVNATVVDPLEEVDQINWPTDHHRV